MTSHALPPGLEPWADPLSVLHPELAQGIAPLVHALESLVRRRDATTDGDGSAMDGYSGLVPRGRPENLALSEWLLAEEVPDEFLRRAAEQELLHLQPRTPLPRPRGRVVVLADTDVDQLGPTRIAHLAAVVVLARRAVEHGAPVVLGLVGADGWLEGDLSALLTPWVRARSRHLCTTVTHVLDRESGLGRDDEVWLLTGDRLARELPAHPQGRRRVLLVREGRWSEHGVSELHAELDGDRMELPLPPAPVCVRALRGAALLTAQPRAAEPDEVAGIRTPRFNGGARRLVFRGAGDDELLVATIAWGRGQEPRIRRHRFRGPVLAAGLLGRRVVAVVLHEDALTVEVVGKPLASVHKIRIPHEDSPFAPDELAAVIDDDLAPVYFMRSAIHLPAHGVWYELTNDRCAPSEFVAMAPGAQTDQPRTVSRTEGGLSSGWALLPDTRSDDAVVFGPDRLMATSHDGSLWNVFEVRPRTAVPRAAITVGRDDQVIGLLVEEPMREPRLVVRTSGGVLVRIVGPDSMSTLTKLSGGQGLPSLHPGWPWLALQRDEVTIEVWDLDDLERRPLRIRTES